MAHAPHQPDALASARAKPGVFLVDDSAVARMMVKRLVDDAGAFEVVGYAANANEAISRLAGAQPDIVLLDIEMPGMDGIEAIPHILRAGNNAPVVILSSQCRAHAEASIRAMAMGASETLLKPSGRESSQQFGEALRATMERIVGDAVRTERDAYVIGDVVERPVCCVAIGASTGGVHALNAFFAALPIEYDMPMLIAQHLPAEFMPFFARQITASSGRNAVVAESGQTLEAGKVFVAPGHAHLAITQGATGAEIDLRGHGGCGPCPSVDPLFASVGQVFGADAIGVMLTGMGRDGAAGAAQMAQAGGALFVQDRCSATIWGMPGAVAQQGIAACIAPPAMLASQIALRARMYGWS